MNKNDKYQEALKRLKQETIPNTYCEDFDKEECINILQELVDKETPKKLIKINTLDVIKGSITDIMGFYYRCPNCKKGMTAFSVFNYCQFCGQRIEEKNE